MIEQLRQNKRTPSIGLVSTYPPTKCGLATFAHSLISALSMSRAETDSLGVIRITNRAHELEAAEIVAHLDPESPRSIRQAAIHLNRFDVAIIEHEFGIFGPDNGAAVIDLVERVQAPIIVTLHTVSATLNSVQQEILQRLVTAVDAVVVMTHAASAILRGSFSVDGDKVHVIPHGAHAYPRVAKAPNTPPTILTWGLLGPGKGIEWGIRALPHLRELQPRPIYQIYGQTHPHVLQAQGERYRDQLLELAASLNVADMLEMRSVYLDHDALAHLVGSSDIVLLPYDSLDQATSGVLIDAVAAGKPVVSTSFPHAKELLSSGAGHIVPQQDPAAIASAMLRLLADRAHYDSACRVAQGLSKSLSWSTVGQRYEVLASELNTHRISRFDPRLECSPAKSGQNPQPAQQVGLIDHRGTDQTVGSAAD
jgi:glycosyltransferase involved in cell wall biosynthesis